MERVHPDELDWTEYDEADARFRRKELSNAATSGGDATGDDGGEGDDPDIGCSLYELAPGDRSWPYHYHTANAEALYVLAGTGTLRCEAGAIDLDAGDYVALPADASGGHRVVNDGDDTLRYLAMSTMREPDVAVYPEMDKIGVFVGAPPAGREERSLHGYYDRDDDVPYWEDDAGGEGEGDR